MKLSACFRSPRTFLFYHNFKRLSRTFFEVFQLFPKPLAKALCRDPSRLSLQLLYLSTFDSFCQDLFSIFFNPSRLPSYLVCRSRGQLAYINTRLTVCQAQKQSFLRLFLDCPGNHIRLQFHCLHSPGDLILLVYHTPLNHIPSRKGLLQD